MMSDKSQITSFPTRALEWYSVFDESVSGKPAKWVNDSNENIFSAVVLIPVSYTHLTLPTICSV